jgi:hypothetical protein
MNKVSDEAMLSLKRRLADWTEWDEAAFFLGRLIGVLPERYSFGNAKAFITLHYSPGEDGRKLILLLNLMADIGIIEMRNNYQEFRWPPEGADRAGLDRSADRQHG